MGERADRRCIETAGERRLARSGIRLIGPRQGVLLPDPVHGGSATNQERDQSQRHVDPKAELQRREFRLPRRELRQPSKRNRLSEGDQHRDQRHEHNRESGPSARRGI